MDFAPYTHSIAVRCLEPQEYEDDERNFFMRHFANYLLYTLRTGHYEFVECTEEKDPEGTYFDFLLWTEIPLDEEDSQVICSWPEVIVAHLNVADPEHEIYP